MDPEKTRSRLSCRVVNDGPEDHRQAAASVRRLRLKWGIGLDHSVGQHVHTESELNSNPAGCKSLFIKHVRSFAAGFTGGNFPPLRCYGGQLLSALFQRSGRGRWSQSRAEGHRFPRAFSSPLRRTATATCESLSSPPITPPPSTPTLLSPRCLQWERPHALLEERERFIKDWRDRALAVFYWRLPAFLWARLLQQHWYVSSQAWDPLRCAHFGKQPESPSLRHLAPGQRLSVVWSSGSARRHERPWKFHHWKRQTASACLTLSR